MLDDDWTWRNLRFRMSDLRILLIELGVPEIFMLENGGKHSGEKAFYPNWMIADLYGSMVGRRHDCYLLLKSGLNNTIQA